MKKLFLAAAVALSCFLPGKAQEFFSTADADYLFNFGARIGINTSNRTVAHMPGQMWNSNSWGLGFDAGVVADINLKNFISLQPGFFFESRSGAFAYKTLGSGPDARDIIQLGKGRQYLFSIPLLVSVHFNITDRLRWDVDFGPYLQFVLKSTFNGKFIYPLTTFGGNIEYFDNPKSSVFDIGLKMGSGLTLFEHYYLGVHYMAGLCNAWDPGKLGGRNKGWVFTIGYTFY